jgi:hypothetical protein
VKECQEEEDGLNKRRGMPPIYGSWGRGTNRFFRQKFDETVWLILMHEPSAHKLDFMHSGAPDRPDKFLSLDIQDLNNMIIMNKKN